MTLNDLLYDIYALEDEMRIYERKYGVLSRTFYELYQSGEEPEDDAWVLDWADWAGAYKLLLRRQEQYQRVIQSLRGQSSSWAGVIERTVRHEPIPVPA